MAKQQRVPFHVCMNADGFPQELLLIWSLETLLGASPRFLHAMRCELEYQ